MRLLNRPCLDSTNSMIKTLEAKGEKGLNLVIWDLTMDEAPEESDEETVHVEPGTYTLRLSLDIEYEATVCVEKQ